MDTSISFVDARAFANSINLLHFLLWFLCLLSLSPSLSSELAESDSELADPESDESELPDSSSDADSEPCFCYSRLRRGISFKTTKTNGCKEVNTEPCVFWIVFGKHGFEIL